MEPPVTPHHYGQTGLKYGGKHLFGEKSLSITEDECVVIPLYTSESPAVEPTYPFCDDTVEEPPPPTMYGGAMYGGSGYGG